MGAGKIRGAVLAVINRSPLTSTAVELSAALDDLGDLERELMELKSRCEILSDIDKARAEERRDTFAAAALTGFLVTPKDEAMHDPEQAANFAYDYADAMLKAREGK